MEVDAAFERASKLFEPDVERMLARQDARTDGHDRASYDEAAGVVTYYRGTTLLWKAHVELLANLVYGSISLSSGGVLRWVWDERTSLVGRRRIDNAYREAKHYKLDALIRNIPQIDEAAALRAVQVAAHFARADGVLVRENQREKTYFALFDAGEGERQSSRSLLPGAMGSGPPPARASYPSATSFPPGAGLYGRASIAPAPDVSSEPASSPVRSIPAPSSPEIQSKTPSLDRVKPAASAALATVVAAHPSFREAALVVSLELSGTKGRFSVQLVAISSAGRLEIVDTPAPVVEAVGRMVSDARLQGELGWRTLVIRIQPKSSGQGFQLAVEPR